MARNNAPSTVKEIAIILPKDKKLKDISNGIFKYTFVRYLVLG